MGNRPILARSNSVIMTACNRSMMARAFVKVWYAEIQLGFPTFANCSCKNIFALKKMHSQQRKPWPVFYHKKHRLHIGCTDNRIKKRINHVTSDGWLEMGRETVFKRINGSFCVPKFGCQPRIIVGGLGLYLWIILYTSSETYGFDPRKQHHRFDIEDERIGVVIWMPSQ